MVVSQYRNILYGVALKKDIRRGDCHGTRRKYQRPLRNRSYLSVIKRLDAMHTKNQKETENADSEKRHHKSLLKVFGLDKGGTMINLYDRMIKIGRALLEPDCNDNILWGGPLWLLWHGKWQEALRAYLPVTILWGAAFGLFSYGFAQHSKLLVMLGNNGMTAGIPVGLAINIWMFRHWHKRPAGPGGHFVLPVLWIIGIFLMLDRCMWLGTVL